ncbi:MAG TPA: hypothetical protein VGL39_08835 [Jatrophihabitantaceae bacterium]|jgi:hypothetical protein
MAAEVLARRGHADAVSSWVDAHVGRLDELPAPREAITDDTWPAAVGDWSRAPTLGPRPQSVHKLRTAVGHIRVAHW